MTDPDTDAAWQALAAHYAQIKDSHIRDLLANDPDRAQSWAVEAAGLYFDYPRHRANEATLNHLIQLARACDVEGQRDAMMDGKIVNISEQRAALHTALRADNDACIYVDDSDVMPSVRTTRETMQLTSEKLRNGHWTGATGKPITDVVNIGIGGSDLGPRLVCNALAPADHLPRMHFLANIDGHCIDRLITRLNPETTLFIVASKSFSTRETLRNAETAWAWLSDNLSADRTKILNKHFLAVTSCLDKARQFGLSDDKILKMPDWVGGRFSLWSAVGLPIAIACGMDIFNRLLEGARAMDTHFREAPPGANMPVLAALLGIWYRNFFDTRSFAALCYDNRLALLPDWLQQLDMESNGKQFDRHGRDLGHATGPVVFGGTGTNAQHAFFQHLHQGSELIPCDFICCRQAGHNYNHHHDELLANCLAQQEALALGAPDRGFAGNVATNAIVLKRLDGYHLGSLLAFYEHKITTQGFIWHLNSFDQPGVELGKTLTAGMLDALSQSGTPPRDCTKAVRGLCNQLKT